MSRDSTHKKMTWGGVGLHIFWIFAPINVTRDREGFGFHFIDPPPTHLFQRRINTWAGSKLHFYPAPRKCKLHFAEVPPVKSGR